MRKRIIACLIASLATASSAAVVLDIQPATFDSLISAIGIQVYGDLTRPMVNGSPVIDFGQTGYMVIPSFAFPRQNFSIESYFRIREYAQADPYISSIVASVSWDGVSSQGVDLRVGGGNHYPLLPADAYTNGSDYVRPDNWTRLERAYLSQSIPNFVCGGSDGNGGWKEDYADRAVCLNEWVHFVGTWEGDSLRIYFNGIEVTDHWRLNGAGLAININPLLNLVIGAAGTDGARHCNGQIKSVRVYDKALSASEIEQRYADLKGYACGHRIHIKCPLVGQSINDSTCFHLEESRDFPCNDTAVAESLLVQIFNGNDFSSELSQVMTDKKDFTLKELFHDGADNCLGVIHVRMCRKSNQSLAKLITADSSSLASLLPLYLVATPSRNNDRFVPVPKARETRVSGPATLYDIRGRYLGKGEKKSGLRRLRISGCVVAVDPDGKASILPVIH